jgi:hypothetical protein
MLAYLALLDYKIAKKSIKKQKEETLPLPVEPVVKPFRRSRSAAITLSLKRIT